MQIQECTKCNQWGKKANDNYCGYCGHLFIDIDMEHDEIILTSNIVKEKLITFKNYGYKDALIYISGLSSCPDFISFEKTKDIHVKKGSRTDVRVTLLEDKIPENFNEQRYFFDCIINNDNKKILKFKIKVKTGPKPVFSKKCVDFGEIEEKKGTIQFLEIGNNGSIPLKLKKIQTEGCPHISVSKDTEFPIMIKKGKIEKILLKWDSNIFNSNIDLKKMKLAIFFGNCKNVKISARAKIKNIQITPDKEKITFDPVIRKNTYTEKIKITNTGNTDIEITNIDCDDDCIDIIPNNGSFTLICSGSNNKKKSSDTVYDFCEFKVHFDPKTLPDDQTHKADYWHDSAVKIKITGQEKEITIPIQAHIVPLIKYQNYIGIDFGTTNSVISFFDDNNNKISLVNVKTGLGDLTSLIPSVLVFEKGNNDKYEIGYNALAEASIKPELTVRSIKRIMGHNHSRIINGKDLSPNKLAGCIIKKLIKLVEVEYYKISKKYYDIKHAIVTVPANFYDLQIRGILEACEDAGLDIEEDKSSKDESADKNEDIADEKEYIADENSKEGIILDEPSAAAIYFIDILQDIRPDIVEKLENNEKLHFLIFDYGGGTLDVSVIRVEYSEESGTGISVLANKGNNKIGGDSIDLRIVNNLLELCKAEYPDFDETIISSTIKELTNRKQRENWNDEIWHNILNSRTDWKKTAEDAKIELSEKEEAEIEIHPQNIFYIENGNIIYNDKSFKSTITKDAFEAWIASILVDCEKVVKGAIELSNIEKDTIDYIIHTGRSSMIPIVRERIREFFPSLNVNDDIFEIDHLKKCVAKGAVMYGLQRRSIGMGVNLLAEGRKIPHSYGTHKSAGIGARLQFDEIIPRGTKYPTTIIKEYSEDVIKGRMLHMTFYQNSGTSKKITNNEEISKIGEITFDTLADNIPGCEIKFTIGPNRKLDITADGQAVPIEPAPLEDEEEWM